MNIALAVKFIQKFQAEVIANQWQDVSTAPSDQNVIIEIVRTGHPFRYRIAQFHDGKWRDRLWNTIDDTEYITRWMYIPE